MRVIYLTVYSGASLCVTKQLPIITTFYLKQIETGILCGMAKVINKNGIYKHMLSITMKLSGVLKQDITFKILDTKLSLSKKLTNNQPTSQHVEC